MRKPFFIVSLLFLLLFGSNSVAAKPSKIVVVGDKSYAPFEFLDADNKPAGIQVELWELWSEKTGIEIDYQLYDWSVALDMVANGEADAIGGMFFSEERAKRFDYSEPYWEIHTSIYFHESIYGIQDLKDLSGFRIGVVKGDYAEEYLLANLTDGSIIPYPTYEEMIQAAVNGDIRVFISDMPVANFHLAKYASVNEFKQTTKPLFTNKLYVAVQKGDTEWLSIINNGFKEITEDELNQITERWIGISYRRELPWRWIMVGISVFMFVLSSVALWNIQLRRRIQVATDDIRKKQEEISKELIERRRAEEALKYSEHQLKVLTDISPAYIAYINVDDFTYRYVNRQFEVAFNLSRQEFVGRHFKEIVGEENYEFAKPYFEEARAGRATSYENVFDIFGKKRWINVNYSPDIDENGNVQGIVNMSFDITERRKAEEVEHQQRMFAEAMTSIVAALNSTLEFESVLQQIIASVAQLVPHEGTNIWLLDDHGAVVRAIWGSDYDKKHSATTESSNREILGKDIRQLPVFAYYWETHQPYLIKDVREDEKWRSFSKTEWIRSYLGIPIIVREKIVGVLQLDSAQPDYFTEEHIDRLKVFANHVAIAVENARLYTSLQQELDERKRLEDTLIESQKLAGLGTLSAGIAHEINSPLQIITGISDSLLQRIEQNDYDQEELVRKLKLVKRNGWRVADIVRSLLNYARPSAQKMESYNLNNLLKESLLLIEHQLKSWSNISITTDYAENLPIIICDREKLFQVFMNLFTNARDAMPEGGNIHIKTRFDENTHFLICEVSDSGPGIPQELRSRIFDPFYTTKPIGKGTGLGLSISQSIIQAHGGDISVFSQPEQGTTFCVRLPEKPLFFDIYSEKKQQDERFGD